MYTQQEYIPIIARIAVQLCQEKGQDFLWSYA